MGSLESCGLVRVSVSFKTARRILKVTACIIPSPHGTYKVYDFEKLLLSFNSNIYKKGDCRLSCRGVTQMSKVGVITCSA
jgi:hypothetical protein